jgi:magnesium chelatase family protein
LVSAARQAKITRVVLPAANAAEAAVIPDLDILPVRTLLEAFDYFSGQQALTPCRLDLSGLFEHAPPYTTDFSEVRSQAHAKRALEVAAAGGHNVLMIGPPGSGKTMLSHRLPSILPELSLKEALETTRIYSISGLLPSDSTLLTLRPFRAPHHTVSDIALIGGGTFPRPGEVSLAHNGVLFLDELPEFSKNALEVLRQPLEEGQVTISRTAAAITFPSRFMLIAAMNPCPCGYYTDPSRECTCTFPQVHKYLGKISGPLLDRFDIHLEVPALRYQELTDPVEPENSIAIRERVKTARHIQAGRYAQYPGVYVNAHLTPRLLRTTCRLGEEGHTLLRNAVERLGLSARAYHRVLKVARTIADLQGRESIAPEHLAEAIQYRALDKQFWGKVQ